MADITPTNSPVQSEATRFRSAVSEALLQLIGGNINYLLASILPVGSYAFTALTEAQWQDETSDGWILADGRDVTGSAYAVLTGNTTAPDARGLFLRGKNNGRSTATGNPVEESLGTYEADTIKAHTHPFTATQIIGGGPVEHDDGSEYGFSNQTTTGNNAGSPAETRPRNLTSNIMFRIN